MLFLQTFFKNDDCQIFFCAHLFVQQIGNYFTKQIKQRKTKQNKNKIKQLQLQQNEQHYQRSYDRFDTFHSKQGRHFIYVFHAWFNKKQFKFLFLFKLLTCETQACIEIEFVLLFLMLFIRFLFLHKTQYVFVFILFVCFLTVFGINNLNLNFNPKKKAFHKILFYCKERTWNKTKASICPYKVETTKFICFLPVIARDECLFFDCDKKIEFHWEIQYDS